MASPEKRQRVQLSENRGSRCNSTTMWDRRIESSKRGRLLQQRNNAKNHLLRQMDHSLMAGVPEEGGEYDDHGGQADEPSAAHRLHCVSGDLEESLPLFSGATFGKLTCAAGDICRLGRSVGLVEACVEDAEEDWRSVADVDMQAECFRRGGGLLIWFILMDKGYS